MKNTMLVLAFVTLTWASASTIYLASMTTAHAGSHCTTTCNTVLGRQYCNTNCY